MTPILPPAMRPSDVLSRIAHRHLLLYLRPSCTLIVVGPADWSELTHALDTEAVLLRHHTPDVGVDAVPLESPLRWRQVLPVRTESAKRSASSGLSHHKTSFSRLPSMRNVTSRAFGVGPSSPSAGSRCSRHSVTSADGAMISSTAPRCCPTA